MTIFASHPGDGGGYFRNRLNRLGNFGLPAAPYGTIRKNGDRFSEKIMLKTLMISRGAVDRAKQPRRRRFGYPRLRRGLVQRGAVTTGFAQRLDEVGEPLLDRVIAKLVH